MTILQTIAEAKKNEVTKLKRERLLSSLKEGARSQQPPRDFHAALKRDGKLSLIAELKKASPSRGIIRPDFDVASLARDYALGGAQALSVLTDETFFQGSLSYLQVAREASNLPVLRKDFLIDEWQVWQAREAGADAILLIVALLPLGHLKDLRDLGKSLGMAVLVEVHDARELDNARSASCELIGVNNRNLNDFTVDFKTTLDLLPRCPKEATVVSESGIFKRADTETLKAAGVRAVLVGEALMTSPLLSKAVKDLMPEGDA